MRFTFKSVGFEGSMLPSTMWVGLIQPAEGLNETKNSDPPPEKREFASRWPLDFICTVKFSWASACWAAL